jgi:hypothetical protein
MIVEFFGRCTFTIVFLGVVFVENEIDQTLPFFDVIYCVS